MSIGSALLSPGGRLGPSMFLKSGLILIVIGFLISVLTVVSPAVLIISGLLSILLLYPWVVIWVKRLHDAGKSGWLVIAVLVVWIIVSIVVSQIITGMFAPPPPETQPTTVSAVFEQAQASARATAIPAGIASAVISFAFVYLGNMLLKSDPGPNPYGPPPAD